MDWSDISQDQEPPEGWPRPPKFNEPGDVPGPPVQYGDPVKPDNVKGGFGYVDNGIEERNLYYYHPDHLGSSSYITDKDGNISQHTEYIAFGEVLFDEHKVSRRMPYLFNGKELDSETGLYYYGARYYDPKTSIWLNVDPLAEKYPFTSPYTYTNNNPIMFVDPDGKDIIIWYLASDGKMRTYDYKYGKNYTGKNKYLIAFHKAANALIKSGASENLKALEENSTKVWISDKNYSDDIGPNFNPENMIISWKPNKGLRTTNGKELTPTAILDHELDHARQYVENPDKYLLNVLKKTGDDYDNAEEMRVIQGSEQSTAKKLGLIKNKENTRKDHRGTIYNTAGVNTTKTPAKDIEEVVITVKRKGNNEKD
ncbi:type IV secretion protein Rhs [Riemerella anatipestifer]|nr:type IV secretion protein Rhs [Riemerella anatipestifer]